MPKRFSISPRVPSGEPKRQPLFTASIPACTRSSRDNPHDLLIAAVRVDEDDLLHPSARHFEPDLRPSIDKIGRLMRDRPLGEDMLIGLANRLHRQDADIEIRWRALCEQLTHAGIDERIRADRQIRAMLLHRREERLNYHDVPGNLTPTVKPYVDRLKTAEGLVIVHPVWNYGYPAILKGYFDRIFLPGVPFTMDDGDRGTHKPGLGNIKKVAFVTTYDGNKWRTMVMGDPPRRIAMRWGWVTFQTKPNYLALYDMNNVTKPGLEAFLAKVRTSMAQF